MEICFYVVVDSSKEERHPEYKVSIHFKRKDARWHIENMITGRQDMRIKRGCGRLYE